MNTALKIPAIIVVSLFLLFAWDYYEAIAWESKATITLDNGDVYKGILSWQSASRLSYRIVTDNNTYVFPKGSISIIRIELN